MNIPSLLKAGVLGLALLSATVPAQAAGFHFGFGNDPFGYRRPLVCIELTDYAIRKEIAAKGYSHIYLNVRNNHRIQVKATKGKWVYLLRVSTCTGAVLDKQPLKHA